MAASIALFTEEVGREAILDVLDVASLNLVRACPTVYAEHCRPGEKIERGFGPLVDPAVGSLFFW